VEENRTPVLVAALQDVAVVLLKNIWAFPTVEEFVDAPSLSEEQVLTMKGNKKKRNGKIS
jgi:hypothetical protein